MTSPAPDSPIDAPVAGPRHGSVGLALLAALYLVSAGLAIRLLTTLEDTGDLPWYVGLFALFFILFTLVWGVRMPAGLLHAVIAVECLVILGLLLIEPEADYMTSLFVLPAYQAAVVFSGHVRWIWVGAILAAILVSQTATLGFRGVGLALTPMAVAVSLAALAAASRTTERARAESEQMVAELEAKRRQLERYAAEVEDLAAMEERNRLVRELHDAVSQAMFAVLLTTRSGQMVLEQDPESLPPHLERLRDLTQEALASMRGFIAELRKPTD